MKTEYNYGFLYNFFPFALNVYMMPLLKFDFIN